MDFVSGVIGVILLVVVFILAFCLYFLPAIIGTQREIANPGPLFLVNLIFGWTLIGWLVCLLWAATGATKAQEEFYRGQVAAVGGAPDPNDPTYREAYARERARLDHLAATANRDRAPPPTGRGGQPQSGPGRNPWESAPPPTE